MSTRFGGVSKNKQQSQIKTALIVCGLLFVALIGVFFVLVQSPSSQVQAPTSITATPVTVVAEPSDNAVKVLVARQRIEEGSQISESMFEAAEWSADNIPPGAILEGKLQLILGQRAMFAAHLMDAKAPLLESSLTDIQPIAAIDIPPGHRAVTINIDKRSGVEGWARADSRVDILWTHVGKDGRKRVAVLVPYAKVLSLGGSTGRGQAAEGDKQQGGSTTVTLLVTAQQAKKVELARTLGDLSLSLVGQVETIGESEDGEAISVDDLLGNTAVAPQEEAPADGVMYDTDPTTGKKRKFLLINGRWKLAAEQ